MKRAIVGAMTPAEELARHRVDYRRARIERLNARRRCFRCGRFGFVRCPSCLVRDVVCEVLTDAWAAGWRPKRRAPRLVNGAPLGR